MKPLLFIAYPYAALVLAILVGVYRYYAMRFSYSSISSELMEKPKLFWGSVPWHYGIIPILLAHLFAGIFPWATRYILGGPVRLFALEMLGMALALFTLWGIVTLIIRRLPTASMPRHVTSPMDWILLFFLAAQVGTGFATASLTRWGGLWYTYTAVPWFWSIWSGHPDSSTVDALPGLVQFHMVNGFTIILLFPFTRLVHIFTVPITYLWRPYQVVVWNNPPHRPGNPGHNPGPAPHRPEPPDQASRRHVLSLVSVASGLFAGAVVAVPSIWFLLGLRKEPQVWRTVGKVADFNVGTTVKVDFPDPSPLPWAGVTARTAAWLRRKTDTDFAAFSINCTHLGCPVRWLPDADLFMCPCHGGVFYNDGGVASGPPPRALTRYPVRVENGMVQILTSPLPIT